MAGNKGAIIFLSSLATIFFLSNIVLWVKVSYLDNSLYAGFSNDDVGSIELRSSDAGQNARRSSASEEKAPEAKVPPRYIPTNDQIEAYINERHCHPAVIETNHLPPYIPGPCNDLLLKYLNNVEKRFSGLGEFDLTPEVTAPEPELLCRKEGAPRIEYTYIKPIDSACFCDMTSRYGPDLSEKYAISALPSQREFQALIRKGMKVLFLPTQKVNFLTDKCLRAVAPYPQFEHFYRKVDPRYYLARVFILGKGFEGYEACMPNIIRMKSCPHKNQFGTIRFTSASIGSKAKLPSTLKEYELRVGRKCFDRFSLLPRTFRLDLQDECEDFWKMALAIKDKEKELYGKWMTKRSDIHRGKAVELLNGESYKILNSLFDKGKRCGVKNTLLIQEYLLNTQLVKGHKFDLRTYMVMANCYPRLVYFHPLFYARLAASIYDPNASDASVALTNRSLAQRLGVNLDDVIYPSEKFERYFYETGRFPNSNWLETDLNPQLRVIMSHLGRNLNFPKACNSQYHKLYGVDFMLLDNFELRLIEVNPGPMLDSEPRYVNRGVAEDVGKIVTQKIMLPSISSKTIDPGLFQPVLDESLPIAERAFGILDPSCFPADYGLENRFKVSPDEKSDQER